MDNLEAQLHCAASTSTSSSCDSISQPVSEIESKITQYEEKIEQLSTLLNQEEEMHRELVSRLEAKVEELQQAMAHSSKAPSTPAETLSPSPVIILPVNKTKIKILEQRIVEMTESLEEKDKRIFELETEIDEIKVELNQVRVEAQRVPELEATILGYQSRECEEEASVPPISEPQQDSRITELEMKIEELTKLVDTLRADKDLLEAERNELVLKAPEEPTDQGVINELKQRIAELEEALEISEMNRKLLRENFTKENEERLGLMVELERIRAYVPTVETPGGSLVTLEDAKSLMKVQQVQIETLNLELNALRLLPTKGTGDATPDTNPEEPDFIRHPPSPACGGCFGSLFTASKRKQNSRY